MIYHRPSEDFSQIKFGDKRLDMRLQSFVETMTQNHQESILSGSATIHDAKAIYMMLANEKVTLEQIQSEGHNATVKRIKDSGLSEVLLVQDSTEINLHGHKKTVGLGYCNNYLRGILAHNCLALAPDGTPLGLVAQQCHTRQVAKSNLTSWEQSNRPIEEKESFRWLDMARNSLHNMPDDINYIFVCDREGDFYELYTEMESLGTSFVIRVAQNRTTTDGDKSVKQIRQTRACGEVEIPVPRNPAKNTPVRTVPMEVAYCQVAVKKPKNLTNAIADVIVLNLVRITEIGKTATPIEWILATNMPLENTDDALKIVSYYTHRWKIERLHLIMKSGCKVEEIQQRSYDRILPVLFIYSTIAAFILAMTYFARNHPDTPCDMFFTEIQWKTLFRMIHRKNKKPPKTPYSIKIAVDYLGEIGSFKHKTCHGNYGEKSIWKGLGKLFDILYFTEGLMG